MRKVTAAVIEKDGKVLIAQRRKESRLGGRWEFPGGKLEPGETPEECLRRELKEEFNIETEIGGLICTSKFKYEHISIELLVYRTTHISGAFEPKDHDAIKWVTPGDLKGYDFVDADKPVVTRLMCGSCK